MPGVESNTIYECTKCHAKFDFQDPKELRNACPFCGNNNFAQLRIVTVCDFCSENIEPEQAFSYPCGDFMYDIAIAGGPDNWSKGDWAACETCHLLIESDERKALSLRSVEMEMKRHPEHQDRRYVAFAVATQIHKGFFEHRSGPVYRGPPSTEGRDDD